MKHLRFSGDENIKGISHTSRLDIIEIIKWIIQLHQEMREWV
jgi:hypothetical protein